MRFSSAWGVDQQTTVMNTTVTCVGLARFNVVNVLDRSVCWATIGIDRLYGVLIVLQLCLLYDDYSLHTAYRCPYHRSQHDTCKSIDSAASSAAIRCHGYTGYVVHSRVFTGATLLAVRGPACTDVCATSSQPSIVSKRLNVSSSFPSVYLHRRNSGRPISQNTSLWYYFPNSPRPVSRRKHC